MSFGQDLSLPKDIPWRRLAFSPDMFDTNLGDSELPRKWRTSVAAFYYSVPEEETKYLYPDRRILYLRVVTSITGCNFDAETLRLTDEFVADTLKTLNEPEEGGLDDFQTSTLETLTGDLSYYSPCRGAILQVAVFPHAKDNVGTDLWQYPYFQDFEPKKREIYETVSESGEVLSGSSSSLNLKKGLTQTEATEESNIVTGASVGFGGKQGFQASISGKWGTEKRTGTETSEIVTTDGSTQKRETLSRTTTLNQMYQPLLAYHLGTNRALWAISPRPHTAVSEFNLIEPVEVEPTPEGSQELKKIGRMLEGIQDMFLVVNMPRDSKGLCFQATLDTGYNVVHHLRPYEPGYQPNQLVVMRRVIQRCGEFDDQDHLVTRSEPFAEAPFVAYETSLPDYVWISVKEINNLETKTQRVFEANARSKQIMQCMLDGYSGGIYKPRLFVETDTFREMVVSSLRESTYGLSKLGFVSDEQVRQLRRRGINTVGDLMSAGFQKSIFRFWNYSICETIASVRQKVLESTAEIGKKIADYQREQYKEPLRGK